MEKRMKMLVTSFAVMSMLCGCSFSVNTSVGQETSSSMKEETQQVESQAKEDSETTEVETQLETETTSEEPGPEVIKITISATGDNTLGSNQIDGYAGSFHEYYDKYGPTYFLSKVQDVIGKDDFTIFNCEGTLTESDNRVHKSYNHKGKPEYVSVFTSSSVEAVALMNNHIMDYGEQGRDDTIATLEEAGMGYAMSGEGISHYGLYETDKGIKIGYVSLAWGDDRDGTLKHGMDKLKKEGATIFVAFLHWGTMKTHKIENAQINLGHLAVDLGYDVVVGCHPHYLQGIEIYKDTPIVYSLGNFCYGGNANPKDKDSMIWQQTFTFVDGVKQDEVDARVIPCRLSSITERNDFCPVVLEGSEATGLLERLSTYCEQVNTYVDNEGRVHLRNN